MLEDIWYCDDFVLETRNQSFGARHLSLSAICEWVTRVTALSTKTYHVEVPSCDTTSMGYVINQAIDQGLVFEECRVMVIDVPMRVQPRLRQEPGHLGQCHSYLLVTRISFLMAI